MEPATAMPNNSTCDDNPSDNQDLLTSLVQKTPKSVGRSRLIRSALLMLAYLCLAVPNHFDLIAGIAVNVFQTAFLIAAIIYLALVVRKKTNVTVVMLHALLWFLVLDYLSQAVPPLYPTLLSFELPLHPGMEILFVFFDFLADYSTFIPLLLAPLVVFDGLVYSILYRNGVDTKLCEGWSAIMFAIPLILYQWTMFQCLDPMVRLMIRLN